MLVTIRIDNSGFGITDMRLEKAVVIGGSIAGMLAARVLADRFESVMIVETMGDAVCALCPVYGQGMTVSALSAMVLQDWLSEGTFIPSRFQKSLAKSNSLHWMVATAQDSRFLTTSGRISKPSLVGKLLAWYNQQVIFCANDDANLHTLFMEIAQLLKSPFALYHPQVIFHVLTQRKRLVHKTNV